MMRKNQRWLGTCVLVLIGLMLLALPAGVMAGEGGGGSTPEDENPSQYYDSILYAEIAAKLQEIQANSRRVKIDVIGQSVEGRDLFLVTVSEPRALGQLGVYQAIRKTMLTDPERAQELIDKFGDFKVPVFINASIHGDEYPGVDAAIRLIETLAYDDSPEVQNILENVILLVNVVQNPDGRVAGTRRNANGFDLNRDFMTQSQPETRSTVEVLTEWNPMVVLDLHGFVTPMLIEPCTPPHNPNYEYDLYIKWALYEAQAMAAELLVQTGLPSQIPFLDDSGGWEDWAATYTPMYGMYHGGYGHTLETPTASWGELTVDAHFAAVWGALKYVAENRTEMIYDQIEIFRRGFLDLPQMLIPDYILDETQWDQYNDLTIQNFPHAYIIPADEPIQYSDHQVARLIEFLLFNDVQVTQAVEEFSYEGTEYLQGSYIVWMNQPKRGLANTILDSGPDLSPIEGLSFYSPPSVWSQPLLWGVHRVEIEDENFSALTNDVKQAPTPLGNVDIPNADYYTYAPDTLAAFQATNELLGGDALVYFAAEPYEDGGKSYGAGSLIVPATYANDLSHRFALDLLALGKLPTTAVQMKTLKIAVNGDEGVLHALRVLGFGYEEISAQDINAGLITEYDLFVNQGQGWSGLSQRGKAALVDFFANGGDYIGLGISSSSVGFATSADIIDVEYATASGNAIVKLDYDDTNSVSAGYWQEDYAFVNGPGWFTDLGDGVDIAASYASGEFLESGYWPGWETSGAAGQPVIVTRAYKNNYVTLIGIDSTFRGHPENTFRLLGNAIYSGLE